jgi:ribosomal protein S18 acetylase RimI-like enzyme
MNNEESGPLTLKLVSMEEKKNFLAMYMSHRMELMSLGIEHSDQGRDDQLSRFWSDPDTNYLLWIKIGDKKFGFAAISVLEPGKGRLLDMGVFREDRGKGIGKRALREVLRFAKYRGLRTMNIHLTKAPDLTIRFFEDYGFKRDGMNLLYDLS